eukprot:jgi/Chrpa1/15400/Chrysochromulina_OHIO_Genome00005171-RA
MRGREWSGRGRRRERGRGGRGRGRGGGGRGRGFGGGEGGGDGGVVCLCLKPFSGCRLWPLAEHGIARSHTLRAGMPSGLNNCTTTMLGNESQLCATFFHANSWEANVKLCLHWPADESGLAKASYNSLTPEQRDRIRKCSKSQVAVIARLTCTPEAQEAWLEEAAELAEVAALRRKAAIAAAQAKVRMDQKADKERRAAEAARAVAKARADDAAAAAAREAARARILARWQRSPPVALELFTAGTPGRLALRLSIGAATAAVRAARAPLVRVIAASADSVEVRVTFTLPPPLSPPALSPPAPQAESMEAPNEDATAVDDAASAAEAAAPEAAASKAAALEVSSVPEAAAPNTAPADRLLADAVKSLGGGGGGGSGPKNNTFTPGLVEVVNTSSDDPFGRFGGPKPGAPPPNIGDFLAQTREREAETGLRLLLYMTYQPCHHSGGRVPKEALGRLSYASSAPVHPATCSESLRDFYIKELRPYGVALELVLADVYKATWDEELHPSEVERQVYSNKSESAREGMRMLLAEGITMRAMQPADWDFIVSLCDPEVQQAWAKRGTPEAGPFSKLHVAMRNAMDQYLAGYIAADWRGDTYAVL